MLPDLESLRCFVAAAQSLSFRKAAREVALSPAAFSERIKRLEQQLDAVLFTRRPREVRLSQAGARLLPQARRALDESRRCCDVVRASSTTHVELTIGTRFELGLSWLTPALHDLASVRPERTLHLYFGDSADLLDRVRTGDIDAAVTSARFAIAGYRYLTLHDEDYVFVAAPRLLAHRPIVRPTDVGDHVLLDLGRDLPLYRYLLDSSGRIMFEFARHEYLGTIAAVRLRLLAGMGVAVLPHYFVAGDLARSRLRRIFPQLKLGRDAFRLVWRLDHPAHEDLTQLAGDLRALPLR